MNGVQDRAVQPDVNELHIVRENKMVFSGANYKLKIVLNVFGRRVIEMVVLRDGNTGVSSYGATVLGIIRMIIIGEITLLLSAPCGFKAAGRLEFSSPSVKS